MLMLAATAYLHRQLTQPRPAARQPGMPSPPLPVPTSNPALARNIPTGLRYQLLCALRGLASGEPMLVRQLPPATDAASAGAVQQPRSPAPEGHHQLEILSVPGTHYPDLIGHLLIAAGCCAPSPQAHWVASLTAFQLTETGYSYYCKLQDWWSTQPWTVRLALRLKE